MLSIGWPEMLVIAAAALIVVGPRDLPALLRNVGKAMGQVRRMSNDFRREINKVVALDEVKDIKKSITQPLSQTRAEIESEFNKITPTGFEPSGKLKPKDPNAESVYDEIRAATADPSADAGEAARASMAAAMKRSTDTAKAAAKPAAKTAKAKTATKTTASKPTTSKPKTAAAKPSKPVAGKKPTAAKATPAKKPVVTQAKVSAAKTAPAPKKPAAKKPVAKKPTAQKAAAPKTGVKE